MIYKKLIYIGLTTFCVNLGIIKTKIKMSIRKKKLYLSNNFIDCKKFSIDAIYSENFQEIVRIFQYFPSTHEKFLKSI